MEEEQCNICLEELNYLLKKNEFEYLLKCNKCNCHVCSSCIKKWYKKEKTCPQCRVNNTFDTDVIYTDLELLLQTLGINIHARQAPTQLQPSQQRRQQTQTQVQPNTQPTTQEIVYNDDRTKVLNSRTGRFVKIDGEIGKRILRNVA